MTATAAMGALVFTAQQVRLSSQGQITDRFTKAVEQLGQPGPTKIDVRLGGVYSLERIMRDSAEDQPTVMEVLAAFVRVHASWPDPNARKPSTPPKAPPVDIQAALTVLGRRDRADDQGTQVNLSHANLTRAELPGAELPGANLLGADLTSANLTGANLTGANLVADLTGVNLPNANLSHANLSHAHLTNAFLSQADLTSANLTGANLTLALLVDSNLLGANLLGAKLDGANLLDADLTRADLTDAKVTRADLTRADLNGANLSGADLRKTIGVTTEGVRCSYITPQTKLPGGVTRPILNAPVRDPRC